MGRSGRCRSGVATGRGAGGIRAGPCKKRAAAAAAGSAGRGARRARYRPDTAAERCSTARPAAAPAPGPSPGPARKAGGAAALRGSPPSAHPRRSRSRYLQPGAAPDLNTCAATLHGAAKSHILLWMCFSFVVLGFFFSPFPPSLNVATAKAEPRPLSAQPGAASSAQQRGQREPERREPSGRSTSGSKLLCTHTYLSRQRPPWTLPAASRSSRTGQDRQAQAAPAPPLRLPPLRLPFYIHLPTAGGARTVYSGSAAGSSQPGTFPPAWTYICERRLMPRCPHGKVSQLRGQPAPCRAPPGSVQSWPGSTAPCRGCGWVPAVSAGAEG